MELAMFHFLVEQFELMLLVMSAFFSHIKMKSIFGKGILVNGGSELAFNLTNMLTLIMICLQEWSRFFFNDLTLLNDLSSFIWHHFLKQPLFLLLLNSLFHLLSSSLCLYFSLHIQFVLRSRVHHWQFSLSIANLRILKNTFKFLLLNRWRSIFFQISLYQRRTFD